MHVQTSPTRIKGKWSNYNYKNNRSAPLRPYPLATVAEAISWTSPAKPPSTAAIHGISSSPAAAPAAGGGGIPGSRHVYSVGLVGGLAGGASEVVVRSVAVLAAACFPSVAGTPRRPAAAHSSFWRLRIFGFLDASRPLHLIGGTAELIWCAGVLVPGLLRRCVAASSGGGAKPGWWCVGARSGGREEALLASPDLVADGWWCGRLRRALAVVVHRARFRHRVADGFCGPFHVRRCSRMEVRRWFSFFVFGDGSGVFFLVAMLPAYVALFFSSLYTRS